MATKKSAKKQVPPSPTEELSVNEVYDVLKFAQNIYQGNYYSPDLINSVMKSITMNPEGATTDNIAKALQDPKNNEQRLIGYTEFMELNSMLFRRVLLYFSGLMSFDWTYACLNIADEKEYKSPAYKKDLQVVRDFFDKFNVKQEFRVAMKQMLRQEAFYSVLRDEGKKFILQELPQKFSKITGRWDYGLLFDFNFQFFMQVGVDIDMYPSIFKKIYNKIFNDARTHGYNPSMPVSVRDSSFVYWVQTSPKDGFTVFKLFPEIATVIPLLAPLLGDASLQPVIRSLQTNNYIQQASKIIFGQVEFLKDAQSKVKDALTLDPATLGKFLSLMKAGIPDAIKVAAAPLANTTALEFSGDNTMYDSYLKSTASVSGVNSRLIYSFDRQNVLETKLSMDIDQNILRPVYAQFENMLEYWINKRTKKYKFKFTFEGFNTSIDRDERMKTAMTLAESGIVMEQKIASAIGLSPFDFRRQLEESRASDFVSKLTPILKSSQMGGADGAGRPSKSDSNLSDGGADSRSAGSNDEKAED